MTHLRVRSPLAPTSFNTDGAIKVPRQRPPGISVGRPRVFAIEAGSLLNRSG